MTVSQVVRLVMEETTRFISPLPVAAEWELVLAAAAFVRLAPARPNGLLRAGRIRFHRLATHKTASILLCAFLPVVIRLAMLGIAPVPVPSIHDEFSHLLLADTLAHGRLTNATHPMWRHFETIHVIQKPTYNSMYPPAQGAFLALGQVVFGYPWAGVVLSCALMFGAICWMMQGWLPPAWAFYGTLVAILKFGVIGLYMNSYISGAVPAFAGALLVGSIPRLRTPRARPLHALLFAAGLIILMNSRPFEGAILGAAGVLYVLPAIWKKADIPLPSGSELDAVHSQKKRKTFSRFTFRLRPHVVRRLLLPAATALACGVAGTAVYCAKVTGSPLRMPYQVNRDTYGWPENLAFLPVKTVSSEHRVLRDMYTMETGRRQIYKSAHALFKNFTMRLFENWTFFIGPVLTVPLLLFPWVILDRRTRPLLIFMAVIAVLNLFQMVLYPYHLAPVVAVMFAILTQAIRHLYISISQVSRRAAGLTCLVLPLCLLLVGAMKQEAAALNLPQAYWEHAAEPHGDARARIEHWLAARPLKQLVIVRYSLAHTPNQEWVYNGADIDGSKVVWARDINAKTNDRLLSYFHGREAWLLDADRWPQHVVHYSPQAEMTAVCKSACPWACCEQIESSDEGDSVSK